MTAVWLALGILGVAWVVGVLLLSRLRQDFDDLARRLRRLEEKAPVAQGDPIAQSYGMQAAGPQQKGNPLQPKAWPPETGPGT